MTLQNGKKFSLKFQYLTLATLTGYKNELCLTNFNNIHHLTLKLSFSRLLCSTKET